MYHFITNLSSENAYLGYTDAMLMVIFGAGASYDSAQAFPIADNPKGGNGGPWRPPLANDLFRDRHEAFGDLIRKYNKLTRILPYLRGPTSERTVEQILESLQEQGRNYPERQRELAAVKFYLADLLMEVTNRWVERTNGITNYAPLLDEILRLDNSGEEICLVTFNYDLLLERALISFRDFREKGPEDFLTSHPRLKIFKLHGSVNWSRTVGAAGALYAPNQIIEQADSLVPSDRFVPANAAREYGAGRRYGSVFPAIAIPVQTKTSNHFECPLAHREYLVGMLPRITKILIIGWQAREAHFLQILHRQLPRLRSIMVVGANEDDAGATLKHFIGEIGYGGLAYRQTVFVAQGGFTNFVISHEGEQFLAS